MLTRTWSEAQIIRLLHLAEKGEPTIADVCRAHGGAENTFYTWRQTYGGLQVNQAKRVREREQENSRLKQWLADAMLDNAILKFCGVMSSSSFSRFELTDELIRTA